MSETEAGAATETLVVERELPHKPEKIWRALTTPALIADWLMPNDFAPEPGRVAGTLGEGGAKSND